MIGYICEFFNSKKVIQEKILNYLEDINDEDAIFNDLIKYVEDNKIKENKYEIKLVLHLLSRISNNHHRSSDFFNKISRVFKIFENEMKTNFSKSEIFNIFKSNKRLLLFLFESEIISPDYLFFKIITNDKYKKRKYPEYFYPEFESFFSVEMKNEINEKNQEISSDSFKEKRREGNNDNNVCRMIQKDSVEEFIAFKTKTNLSVNAKIESSLFETNLFLTKNEPSLIEYAAFYGSIQIFNYLRFNNADLQSSLWLYAIYGNNPEIIHLLEENKVQPYDDQYIICYKESIKCHHINIMNYIEDILLQKVNGIDLFIFLASLKFFNFIGLSNQFEKNIIDLNDLLCSKPSNEEDNKSLIFNLLCKFDYYEIVKFFLNNVEIDVNICLITN